MFTPQAIGFVNSPHKDTAAIPNGLGAKHDAEGMLAYSAIPKAKQDYASGFHGLSVVALVRLQRRSVSKVQTDSRVRMTEKLR
jgi:hypothetical protein